MKSTNEQQKGTRTKQQQPIIKRNIIWNTTNKNKTNMKHVNNNNETTTQHITQQQQQQQTTKRNTNQTTHIQ